MDKVEFEIKVVRATNDLIQEKLTRNVNEMKGWCVPFTTQFEQAIIDSIHNAKRNLASESDNDLWNAVLVELNAIAIYKFGRYEHQRSD